MTIPWALKIFVPCTSGWLSCLSLVAFSSFGKASELQSLAPQRPGDSDASVKYSCGGLTLSINSCHLNACEKLWKFLLLVKKQLWLHWIWESLKKTWIKIVIKQMHLKKSTTLSVAFLDIALVLKYKVKIQQKLILKYYIHLLFNITKLAKSSEIVTSSFSYDLFWQLLLQMPYLGL